MLTFETDPSFQSFRWFGSWTKSFELNLLVGGSKGKMVESAPLQNTVISLVTGCRNIIDIHLRAESNGRMFRTSNSKILLPETQITMNLVIIYFENRK